tara:strand:+ start:1184 stop:1351 length:168 start_codon:yes stop_codon:yes gene_type:complete
MKTELLAERAKLLRNKKHSAIKLVAYQESIDQALYEFAAADMALKEFERKHGVEV